MTVLNLLPRSNRKKEKKSKLIVVTALNQTTINQMPYEIQILDRAYRKWSVKCSDSGEAVDMPTTFDPFSSQVFDGDIFESSSGTAGIITSRVRSSLIPGVLVLRGNRMLGRVPGSRRANRFYYKCIPNDRALPAFLVPYSIKFGFTKHLPNMFFPRKAQHF